MECVDRRHLVHIKRANAVVKRAKAVTILSKSKKTPSLKTHMKAAEPFIWSDDEVELLLKITRSTKWQKQWRKLHINRTV